MNSSYIFLSVELYIFCILDGLLCLYMNITMHRYFIHISLIIKSSKCVFFMLHCFYMILIPKLFLNYSRITIARTPLEPWKYVQDRGSSS